MAVCLFTDPCVAHVRGIVPPRGQGPAPAPVNPITTTTTTTTTTTPPTTTTTKTTPTTTTTAKAGTTTTKTTTTTRKQDGVKAADVSAADGGKIV